jgi:hypothetical protein
MSFLRYTFAVKIRSDDTGWDQYADRWEVLNGTRGIIYQRVLGHPHVNEQPFTRSLNGMKVPADIKTEVLRSLINL